MYRTYRAIAGPAPRTSRTLIAGVLTAGIVCSMGCGSGGSSNNGIPLVTDRATILVAGGYLKTATGTLQLLFPSGAVSSNTEITVTSVTNVPTDPRLVGQTAFLLSPSIIFAKPASLSIRYDTSRIPTGGKEEDLQLYRVGPAGFEPVMDAIVDTKHKVVTAPIQNSSSYAVLANNPFYGTYQGSFDGNADGTWQGEISPSGKVTATIDLDGDTYQGTGTISMTSTTKMTFVGQGGASGAQVTFTGSASTTANGTTLNGTWTSNSGESGTWTGTRTQKKQPTGGGTPGGTSTDAKVQFLLGKIQECTGQALVFPANDTDKPVAPDVTSLIGTNCIRDTFVAAAMLDAWAAEAHMRLGQKTEAQANIADMNNNLQTAKNLCSDVPGLGGPNDTGCKTLNCVTCDWLKQMFP